MNGVVHQCKQGAASEEELLMATFQYIEGLVDIVRPKKYLFIALDGTTPSDLPTISLLSTLCSCLLRCCVVMCSHSRSCSQSKAESATAA